MSQVEELTILQELERDRQKLNRAVTNFISGVKGKGRSVR